MSANQEGAKWEGGDNGRGKNPDHDGIAIFLYESSNCPLPDGEERKINYGMAKLHEMSLRWGRGGHAQADNESPEKIKKKSTTTMNTSTDHTGFACSK